MRHREVKKNKKTKKQKTKKETENQKRVAISTWGSDHVALCKKLGKNPEILSHGLLILIKSAIYRTPLRKEVMLFGHKQLLKSRFSTLQYIKNY